MNILGMTITVSLIGEFLGEDERLQYLSLHVDVG